MDKGAGLLKARRMISLIIQGGQSEPDLLKRITVRFVEEWERPEFDRRLREKHYLHASTLAWGHVMARPGRALCVEVRRDLLADPFEPFAEMQIGPAKVARLAVPFVNAILSWW